MEYVYSQNRDLAYTKRIQTEGNDFNQRMYLLCLYGT